MRKVEIKMARNKRFFIAILSIMMAITFNAEAATRSSSPTTPGATRRSVAVPLSQKVQTTVSVAEQKQKETESEKTESVATKSEQTEPEPVVVNKSSDFGAALSSVFESAVEDNSFAEQIRKQRAALAAADATSAATSAQQAALKTSSNQCDRDLRKCMAEKCGNDFTGCATDGATLFGDKLNACHRNTECTAEEFRLFTTEITADRDLNVKMSSYENVITCGNQYNACIVNECGKTYNKCLGKKYADAAIQKCATIAQECTEADSGLANRFGVAVAKLRENAEKEVKKDEERMYAMRDSMSSICKKLGAMFDERSFDCVFTVNFFAGNDQSTPMASRKRYAGDTFVCMQEWFGVNVTTYKENAYRETRAQTGASSAMLGSGVGTAVGLVSSNAIGRALDTQKAKKAVKEEENLKKEEEKQEKKEAKEAEKAQEKADKQAKKDTKEQEKQAKKDTEKADKDSRTATSSGGGANSTSTGSSASNASSSTSSSGSDSSSEQRASK